MHGVFLFLFDDDHKNDILIIICNNNEEKEYTEIKEKKIEMETAEKGLLKGKMKARG